MKIIPLFFLVTVAGAISSCQAAHAFTISDAKLSDAGLDLSVPPELKASVCQEVYCLEHFSVDELKTSGTQIAAIHVSFRYYF